MKKMNSIEVKNKFVSTNVNNLKVFFLFEKTNLTQTLKKNKIKFPNNVLNDFSGKSKEIIQFYNKGEIVVLCGFGDNQNNNSYNLKEVIKHLCKLLKNIKKDNIIFYLLKGKLDFLKNQIQYVNDEFFEQKTFVKNFFKIIERKSKRKLSIKNSIKNEGSFKSSMYKNSISPSSKSFKTSKLLKNDILFEDNKNNNIIFISENQVKPLQQFIDLLEKVKLVKYLGDAPANILTPPRFVNILNKVGRMNDLNVEIMGNKKLRKMGMNTLLSVSSGSKYSGYLVKLQSKHANLKEKPIVFVGKGITFDSGGLSLKRPKSMIDMKNDMLGAGTIMGVANYLGKIKCKKNVIFLLAIAENMPDRRATRPGDVVKSYSGKLVEIVDTDAEGRLVMADAISYAHEFNPKLIINVAGLTGQQSSLSGGLFASVLGNNKNQIKKLIVTGEKTNEKLVEFPIYPENMAQTKSEIANVKNYNYKYRNSTIYAAAFLCNFVKKNQPWVHIDIAGPEYTDGSTGFGVRLLSEFVLN